MKRRRLAFFTLASFALGAVIATGGLVGCDDGATPADGAPEAAEESRSAPGEHGGAGAAGAAGGEPTPAHAATSAPVPEPLPEALVRAVQLIARGQFEPARRELNAYLEEHPDDGQGVFLLGLSHHKQKRYGRAKPYFERAVELAPEYDPIHHFFGYCLYYLGDVKGARREFGAHLATNPGEADSHFGMGLVELEDGRLEKAEARFRRGIELNEQAASADPRRERALRPDIAKGYARLGDVAFARGEYEEARDLLLRSLALNRANYSVYHTLSLAYRRLGDDEAADEARRQFEAVKQQVRPGDARP